MGELNIGDKAPYFEGVSVSGKPVKLSDYQGKILVLFFYPNTARPRCKAQASGFRDVYGDFVSMGAEIVGISVNDNEAQERFSTTNGLQFPLIADTGGTISRLYGGVGRLGKTNRSTFLVGRDGAIKHIWKLTGLLTQVSIKKLGRHAETVKDAVKKLP